MNNPTISSSFSIEITIRSAESLTIGNQKPIRKNVFVSISIPTDNNQDYYPNNQSRTRLSRECHTGELTWNETLLMAVQKAAKFIILEVHHKKRSSEKLIGFAKIPTSDFIGDNMPLNYRHCLSYRLRDCNGESNGIINFNVNVLGKMDYNQGDNERYNYREEVEIQGFSNRDNYNGPKPCIGTTSLFGGRGKYSAAVVGVPAAWYNSCHA